MIRYSTQIMGPAFSDTIIAELDPRFSRRTVQVAATDGPLPFGLVLTRMPDGAYAPLTVAAVAKASEGAETAETAEAAEAQASEACAILASPLEASETARQALVIGGYAIVNPARLVWDASVKDRDAALAQLEARGFVFKEVEDGAAE